MRLKFLVLIGMLFAMPLMATGPRVSPNLISVKKNEIYALDLPPFISTEVANEGALSEIVFTAFAEENIEVIINIVPLQSMLKYYLAEENALAVMGRHLGINTNAKHSLVSMPLFVSTEEYIYYKPKHKKLSYEDTRSNKKDLTYGASKGEDVTAYQKASINVKKSRALSMFKKLKQESVDFISLPQESTQWFLENKYTDEKNSFAVVEGSSRLIPIEIYFNLNNPQGKKLASAFKKGLQAIVKNGKYTKILEKHIKDPSIIKLQTDHIHDALK